MLRIASDANAVALIGENVPNLIQINQGKDFKIVLNTLAKKGYPHIAWRTLNSRMFGLPQERRRLFIVASKERRFSEALHADLSMQNGDSAMSTTTVSEAAGFYWTGGKRSICFSRGYVPAIKIGATDGRGRSPVAVFTRGRVRKLSATECMRLQGFSGAAWRKTVENGDLLRMAGNAVALPVGHFVMDSVLSARDFSGAKTGFCDVTESGILENEIIWNVDHPVTSLATNLDHFLDDDNEGSLSAQAAAGLIVRSVRSGHSMPIELFEALYRISKDRTQKLHPSRGNSFEMLDQMAAELGEYRMGLTSGERKKCHPLPVSA